MHKAIIVNVTPSTIPMDGPSPSDHEHLVLNTEFHAFDVYWPVCMQVQVRFSSEDTHTSTPSLLQRSVFYHMGPVTVYSMS